MNRRMALAGTIAVIGAAALIPALAHEGHGKLDSGAFDPNAPRRVTPETAELIGLKTVEVDFGQVEEVVRLAGTVVPLPDRTRALAPKTGGVVTRVGVQVGDAVKAGDVLGEVDSPELARNWYEVRKLEAEYGRLLAEGKRAEANVRSLEVAAPAADEGARLAEAEVQRLSSAGEAVSVNTLSARRAEALKLRSEATARALELEQARVEAVSLRDQGAAVQRSAEALRALVRQSGDGSEADSPSEQTSLVRLVSLIDGVVTMRGVIEGQGVQAGQELLIVADFAVVQIEGELPESLVDRVAAVPGAQVRIRHTSDEAPIGAGTVRFVSPVVDPVKRTTHVIATAENPDGRLRQGMFVDLAVVLRQNDAAVVVPASAVLKDGPARYVWLKDKDLFKKQEIAIGAADDRIVEVTKGLAPGDIVVSEGAFAVSQLRGVSTGSAAQSGPATPTETKPATNDHSADGHTH